MESTVSLSGPLEPRDAWVADACPIVASLEVVGTRSAFVVLREAFYGATRFEEFVRRTGASEPTVAARLKELVEAGVLQHEEYRDPGKRARRGYRLTEKGTELFPVLVSLMRWGTRWESAEGRGHVDLRHRGCGAPVAAEVRCAEGHEVGPGDAELTWAGRSRRS